MKEFFLLALAVVITLVLTAIFPPLGGGALICFVFFGLRRAAK